MKKVQILMYHQVGDFPSMKTHRATYCHYKRFAVQMAYLSRMGYNVIPLKLALDGLGGRSSLPDRTVVLTFDDGYENFYHYAAPVLRKYNFPATVFLISGMIGGKATWLAADGHEPAALMDIGMIKELQETNIDFSSHGNSHVRLTQIERSQARNEIVESRHTLEDLLGHEVTSFCYPYGDFDQAIVDMTAEAGYTAGLTCIRGAATAEDNPLVLPRKAISYGDSLIGFMWKLKFKDKKKI